MTETTEATQPTPSAAAPSLWLRIRWFGVLLVIAVVFAAAGGHIAGQRKRSDVRAGDIAQVAQQQFDLGLEDLATGRFELARQRFEYVIRLDPTFPQAAEQLAIALVGLNAPVATVAPLATPTPNLAPVEDLFAQALAAYENKDWNVTIDTLLALRAKDASYRSVEVDGMMYAALRNRGVQHIRDEGLLEEGCTTCRGRSGSLPSTTRPSNTAAGPSSTSRPIPTTVSIGRRPSTTSLRFTSLRPTSPTTSISSWRPRPKSTAMN